MTFEFEINDLGTSDPAGGFECSDSWGDGTKSAFVAAGIIDTFDSYSAGTKLTDATNRWQKTEVTTGSATVRSSSAMQSSSLGLEMAGVGHWISMPSQDVSLPNYFTAGNTIRLYVKFTEVTGSPGLLRFKFGKEDTSSTNQYVLEWNTAENYLRLQRDVDGNESELCRSSVSGGISVGQAYRVEVDWNKPDLRDEWRIQQWKVGGSRVAHATGGQNGEFLPRNSDVGGLGFKNNDYLKVDVDELSLV